MNQTADFERRVANSIGSSIAVQQNLLRDSALVSSIAGVSEILLNALKSGNKLLLFGNGGSAADAQHIAAEFVGRFAFARPGDVAIGFSTSGNSPNVLNGVSTAKKIGLHTIAFTGTPGGKLKQAADLDHCLCAPSGETSRIQECHILIGHIVSELVEQELFHGQSRISGS